MPHKRNPVTCEQLCGLARVLRSNAMAGIENVALWHERDISHSSVERIILPDSTTLLHYMLHKLNWVMEELIVYPENMAANMEKSFGLVYSQHVLLALIKKGVTREQAYAIVQRNAMNAWSKKTPFREFLEQDSEVKQYLNAKELNACFNPNVFTQQIDKIFQKQEWCHAHQKRKKTVRR
jgi:adenylosuccinate lyase